MKRGLLILALAVIVLAGAYIIFSGMHTPPAPQVTTATDMESGESYSIDAQYPQFGIPAIDSQIRAALQEQIAEIKDYPALPPDSATKQNALVARFGNAYIGPDIVSAELIFSVDTGGAHPNTLISGVAFDRATGKRLELNDALSLIGKSVADVSASSSAQFSQAFGDGFFAEGADTNPENFSSFSVSKEAVTFIFQPYQVAAYAAGPQRAVFPRVR